MYKFINFIEEHWKELAILVLAITFGFGLGRFTMQATNRTPIIIQQIQK